MKTRTVNTRFMRGNIDVDGHIFNVLANEYGMSKVCASDFDTDTAIYSDGFIDAIEDGKTPVLELFPTDSHRFYSKYTEYHHVIIDDTCYNIYFK